MPIVLIAGSADRHAQLDDVTALFNRVQSHAKLVIFEGAVHEALDKNNPQLYRASLFESLEASAMNQRADHIAPRHADGDVLPRKPSPGWLSNSTP